MILARPVPHPSSKIVLSLNMDVEEDDDIVDWCSLSKSRVSNTPLFHTATIHIIILYVLKQDDIEDDMTQ